MKPNKIFERISISLIYFIKVPGKLTSERAETKGDQIKAGSQLITLFCDLERAF